jgi:hypothetical protein
MGTAVALANFKVNETIETIVRSLNLSRSLKYIEGLVSFRLLSLFYTLACPSPALIVHAVLST